MIPFELYVIALSTPLIGLFEGYCSGMSDETAYDEKAIEDWLMVAKGLDGDMLADFLKTKPHFTSYHVGHPSDSWHWYRRGERYGGYVTTILSGIAIGWSLWLIPMFALHIVSGFVGFRLGSDFGKSYWITQFSNFLDRIKK